MTTMEDLERVFDDHPSLDASLADFEPESAYLEPSPRFSLHQSANSGYRSDDSDSEKGEPPFGNVGGYSPPTWRRSSSGSRITGFWSKNNGPLHLTERDGPILRAGRFGRRFSREPSPQYENEEGDEDATLAAALRTRLPTGSVSPEKGRSPSPNPQPTGGGESGRILTEVKKENTDKNAALSSLTGAPVPRGLSGHDNSNNCMLWGKPIYCRL